MFLVIHQQIVEISYEIINFGSSMHLYNTKVSFIFQFQFNISVFKMSALKISKTEDKNLIFKIIFLLIAFKMFLFL